MAENLSLFRRSVAVMVNLVTKARADFEVEIVEDSEDEAEQLLKLDNYLCDLKELQIRDGLHVFGRSPAKGAADGLLAQILRTPRGDGEGDSRLFQCPGEAEGERLRGGPEAAPGVTWAHTGK